MTTKTYMVIALMAITMSISMPMAFATSFDLSVNVGKAATDRNLSISGDLTNINEAGHVEDHWIIQNVTITRNSLDVPKTLTASGIIQPINDLNGELVAYAMNLLFKDDGGQIVKDFDLFFGTLTQVGDATSSSDLADSSTYSIYGNRVISDNNVDNGRTINIQNGTLSVEGLS